MSGMIRPFLLALTFALPLSAASVRSASAQEQHAPAAAPTVQPVVDSAAQPPVAADSMAASMA
ncbi:MAG: hypothetical protein ACO1Q7_07940, partial [Gemmatimonas sp.]